LTGSVFVVLTQTPGGAAARALAGSLAEARLAAFVRVGAPMEPLYHWRGQIETMRIGADDPDGGEGAGRSRGRGRESDSLAASCRRTAPAPN
jgi:hypothetical protein